MEKRKFIPVKIFIYSYVPILGLIASVIIKNFKIDGRLVFAAWESIPVLGILTLLCSIITGFLIYKFTNANLKMDIKVLLISFIISFVICWPFS
jgi:hypothetical protein